jgi:hypothetical protein
VCQQTARDDSKTARVGALKPMAGLALLLLVATGFRNRLRRRH